MRCSWSQGLSSLRSQQQSNRHSVADQKRKPHLPPNSEKTRCCASTPRNDHWSKVPAPSPCLRCGLVGSRHCTNKERFFLCPFIHVLVFLYSHVVFHHEFMPEKYPRKKKAQRFTDTKRCSIESNNGFVQHVSSCGELDNYTPFSHPTLPSKSSVSTRCSNTLSHGGITPFGT